MKSRHSDTQAHHGSRLRRLAMLVAAGALVIYGRRARWAGRIAASLAATMAARALSGHDDLARFLGTRSAAPTLREAAIDQTVEDSFPASDPPSYTATAGASSR